MSDIKYSHEGSLFIMGPLVINAGCWIINGTFHVYVRDRPCLLHRLMARMLLGWRWEDSGQQEAYK